MSISEVVSVISPPKIVVDPASDATRADVEAAIGAQLPDDLFDVSRTYGTGRFSNGAFNLMIGNPASDAYCEAVQRRNGIISGLKESEGKGFIAYDVFPKQPGLLSLGTEDNGDKLYWLTEGKPEEWPIMILRRHGGAVDRFPGPLTSFLAGVFSGSLTPHPWPHWISDPGRVWTFLA